MTLTDIFSNRSVSIALAPELLTAVVRSGTRIVAYTEIRIPPAPGAAPGHWQGALNVFRGYLRQAGLALGGAPLSVSLSTRWCQLAMLPWSEALLYEDSAQRHAQARFGALYGAAARDWAIVCDEAPFGQPRLACALERVFLDSLRQIAAENGHPCRLVESALSSAWRALAGSVAQSMVLIEPGRMVLAVAAGAHLAAVQAQVLHGPWQQQLPLAWQQWSLCAPELGDIAQVALVRPQARLVA